MSIVSALAGASRSTVRLVLPAAGADTNSDLAVEKNLLEYFSDDGVVAEIDRAKGNLVERVHSLQAANPGAWIVVSSKMRSGISRSVLGSTADALARGAPGPIVVVPDEKVMRLRLQSAHDATRDHATSL